MRIAVIGAGLLGQSIMDAVAFTPRKVGDFLVGHDGPETWLLTHRDIEITDYTSCARALDGFDVAVLTAAYHRLGECEASPERAVEVNTYGAQYVSSLLPTVYISTDYVFNDKGPHDESLPGEQPRSVYGRSKLGGELATLEHGGIVVRVSGLFGHHPSHKGPTFPETILSSHDPIRLPTDQVFSPTYAPDAARRIVDLALDLAQDEEEGGCSFGPDCCPIIRPSGIYHAANDGATSWAAFGQEIADITRHDRHITAYKAHDPIRPKNSSLVSTRLPPLRHWRSALVEWESKR